MYYHHNYNCKLSNDASTKELWDWLCAKTNRHVSQAKFLYNVCGDLKTYLELEEAIVLFHYRCYCPDTTEDALYLVAKLRVWKAMGWADNTYKL